MIIQNSIEHDLDLVDIKHFFKSKDFILKYFTENQIHNEARFSENDNLKIFNHLRFDALVQYSRDRNNKALIPVQYERTAKSKRRYEKIISDYYCEASISMIIYIIEDSQVKKLIQNIEKKVQKDKDVLKIFYGTLSDLSKNCNLIKFYNQNNKFIAIQ